MKEKGVDGAPGGYGEIVERARKLSPTFAEAIAGVPYEEKGILNSEMLFMRACMPELFSGRVIESGRARGQSTLVLSLTLPHTSIVSIEFNENSPDVPVAAARLAGRKNVTFLFGDAEDIVPREVREGDVVLIDGPKMFRAVRFAIRLLAGGKPVAVFMHDMHVGTPERAFLDRFFPEALFSDARRFAEISSSLDSDAVARNSPHKRIDSFEGDFGYGFTLAYLPRVAGRAYRFLLAISYPYDALCRVARRLGMSRR